MLKLFKILIIIFIIFVVFICICGYSISKDDIDSCLSSGVCKEGLIINDDETGLPFEINKKTCNEHKGKWREKYNDCLFLD